MLSFAQPLFLAATALIAIPIALHLARQRVAKERRFPSIRFVRQQSAAVERRRVPDDLPLLLARCLIIVLLALALANPWWRDAGAAEGRQIAVLVDTSASMERSGAPDAVSDAVETFLASETTPADRVELLFGDAVVHRRISLRGGSGKLPSDALFAARSVPLRPSDLLLQAVPGFDEQRARELVIVSDFQRSQWNPGTLAPVAGDISVRLIPVFGERPVSNVVVAGARSLPAESGRRLEVTIRNDARVQAGIELKLSPFSDPSAKMLSRIEVLGPSELDHLTIDLPEGVPEAGWIEASVTFDDRSSDALAFDNRRAVWLAPPPPQRVAVWYFVDEDPSKAPEVAFVSKALSVEPLADQARFIAVAADDESADVHYAPGSLDVLPEQVVVEFKRALEAGATVVITPGRNPRRAFYLLAQNGLLEARHLGTFRSEWMQGVRQSRYVGAIPETSPLRAIFEGEAASSLAAVRLREFEQVEPPSNARIWLQTEEGEPLLFEVAHGAGAIRVFTFGLDTASSPLPLNTGFLPIVREAFQAPTATGNGLRKLETGSAWRVGADADDVSGGPTLADRLLVRPWVGESGDGILEVNVPLEESALAQVDLDAVSAALTGGAAGENGSSLAVHAVDKPREPTRLSALFALLALLALVIEQFLAQRKTAEAS